MNESVVKQMFHDCENTLQTTKNSFHNCNEMLFYKKRMEFFVKQLQHDKPYRRIIHHFRRKHRNRNEEFYTTLFYLLNDVVDPCCLCYEIYNLNQEILAMYKEKKNFILYVNQIMNSMVVYNEN